jgi:hypothetical protein
MTAVRHYIIMSNGSPIVDIVMIMVNCTKTITLFVFVVNGTRIMFVKPSYITTDG